MNGLPMSLNIYNLREDDFEKVVSLTHDVFDKNYTTLNKVEEVYRKGCSKGINASLVAYDGTREDGRLVGLRLTYAPGNWEIDQWCSPELWRVPPDKVCYFKTNCIHPDYSGKGLGGTLIKKAIEAVKQQGAEAGIAHIWMNSPHNSAQRYFTKAGGELVKIWQDKWLEELPTSTPGRYTLADVIAAEMIIYF